MSTELNLFGWELLYKLNESILKTKQDVLVCFTHWVFIRQGFRSAGVGEDKEQPRFSELTELLPDGWNLNYPYKLRYVYDKKLYLLSGLEIDSGDMLFNLNRLIDEQVFGITIDVSEVRETSGPIFTMIPNYAEIAKKLTEDLIEPLLKIEITKEAETQTSAELISAPPRRVYRTVEEIELPTPPTFPYVGNVGLADLHPLISRTGGGMLFQTPGMSRPRPTRPDPGLPPGAVPPGARYDPIRPLGPNRPPSTRRRNPDHDHLPPPGYDDMFM